MSHNSASEPPICKIQKGVYRKNVNVFWLSTILGIGTFVQIGRPLNKGFDYDNDEIYEGAHVLIANEKPTSTLKSSEKSNNIL